MCSNPDLSWNLGENSSNTSSDQVGWTGTGTGTGMDGIERSSNTIVMSGYNAYSTLTSTTQPEIVTTIQQLQIEVEVIAKAIEIFYRIHSMKINDNRGNSVEVSRRNKSVKGSRKVRLIFYCVFMAYNELGCPVDPAYAADIVKLPRKEIEQALSEYAPPGNTLIQPEKMVMFYIKGINFLVSPLGISYNAEAVDREVRRVIEVCRTTPAGREWIQNTAAKIVAIAALYFYMNDIKGFETAHNVSIFEQACYLSWACIRRYHEQIAKYYNSDTTDQMPIYKPKISIQYLN